jgi:ribosomal protein L29
MNFIKMFEEEKNQKEILNLTKELVELRIKKKTRQKCKPDTFKKTKKKIAQILTLKNLEKQ